MNNYQDRWGRFHDKPCIDGEPSSNNGWIFTAYWYKLNNIHPNLQYTPELVEAGEECAFLLKRHPAPIENRVPMSRDEVLGLSALGFELDLEGWNFSPYPVPKFNPFKLTAQLWELRPTWGPAFNYENRIENQLIYKHRNYFWQNNLDQLYRFAFSVPLQDRAFILRQVEKSNLFYSAVEWVSKQRKATDPSSRLIEWLKWGDKPDLELFEDYFGEDHPFCQKIRGEL